MYYTYMYGCKHKQNATSFILTKLTELRYSFQPQMRWLSCDGDGLVLLSCDCQNIQFGHTWGLIVTPTTRLVSVIRHHITR